MTRKKLEVNKLKVKWKTGPVGAIFKTYRSLREYPTKYIMQPSKEVSFIYYSIMKVMITLGNTALYK